MKKFSLFVIVVAAALAPYAIPGRSATSAAALPSLAPMLQRAAPAVVNVSVSSTQSMSDNPLFQDPMFRRFFGLPNQLPEQKVQAVGSGVVYDASKGYIVTNNHVVQNADKVVVTLKDRRQLKAKIVGTDKEADIAVIKVQPDHLTQIQMGNSDDLKVGDFVVAIGNPFGLGQTATLGIVSALGRTGLGIEGYEDFIQTDASINPGNSGGALVNQEGQLVGLNTAILSRSGGNIGIGFAIPVNMVKRIADEIIKYGKVRRGQLGVLIQDLTPDLRKAMGVEAKTGAVVSRVQPDSPAEKAGIKAGDVIVGLDGKPVKGSSDLKNRIGLMSPGQKIELEVMRNKETLHLSATLEKRQENETEASASGILGGMKLTPIPQDHPLYGKVKGVLVAAIRRDSDAYQAGLRAGDVIVTADRKPVTSPSELMEIAKKAGNKPLLLNVRRGDEALFIAIS